MGPPLLLQVWVSLSTWRSEFHPPYSPGYVQLGQITRNNLKQSDTQSNTLALQVGHIFGIYLWCSNFEKWIIKLATHASGTSRRQCYDVYPAELASVKHSCQILCLNLSFTFCRCNSPRIIFEIQFELERRIIQSASIVLTKWDSTSSRSWIFQTNLITSRLTWTSSITCILKSGSFNLSQRTSCHVNPVFWALSK